MGFEDLTELSAAGLRKLNDMLRWLFTKVQGGIAREDLSPDLLADIDTVDGSRLADDSVTGDKIGYCAIETCHIDEAAIGSAQIQDAGIGTAQIQDAAVTNEKVESLSADKLTAGVIDAGVIDVKNLHADNITVGTINGAQIAHGAITGDHLADAVNDAISGAMTVAEGKNTIYYQASQPAGGTYTVGDVWFDTAHGYKMYAYNGSAWAASQFGTDAIAANSITAASGIIASLDGGKIVTGTITAASGAIADAAITTAKIADSAITNAKIQDATIAGAKIANAAITGAKIASATITDANIASLNASKIAAGTMTADRISGGTLLLGGSSNGNGAEIIKDANDNTIILINKDGQAINVVGTYTSGISSSRTVEVPFKIHSEWLNIDAVAFQSDQSFNSITTASFDIGRLILRQKVAGGNGLLVPWNYAMTIEPGSIDIINTRADNSVVTVPLSINGKMVITGTPGSPGNLTEWGDDGTAVDTGIPIAGLGRAFSGSAAFGSTNTAMTTTEFITMLTSMGAFSQPYWVARGSWSYGNNRYITDTGCGNIHLAGATVEVMGTSSVFTIRVHTPTTSSTQNGITGTTYSEFVYINNGSSYSPGWRKLWNSKNDGVIPQATGRLDAGTGSSVTNQLIQCGWDYVTGDGTNRLLSKSITFPVAYDSGTYPVVVPTAIGGAATGSSPTSIGAFVNNSLTAAQARSVGNTGCTVDVSRFSRDGADPGVLASTVPYGFSWIAIGTKSR